MPKHQCANRYIGEGARGGCYFEIRGSDLPEHAELDVGWSCVVVHRGAIPVTWLSEIIAIATNHEGGIPGFLRAHNHETGGYSYALMCDPEDPAKGRIL